MALACLCAALFSIVVYGATASRFGIPTSQSHSLIAGLTGAAIALGGASSVNVHEWMKVIYGLALSIGLGFVMGLGPVQARLDSFRRRQQATRQRLL